MGLMSGYVDPACSTKQYGHDFLGHRVQRRWAVMMRWGKWVHVDWEGPGDGVT